MFLQATFESMGPRLQEVYNHLFVAEDLPEVMKPVLLKFILKDGKDRSEVSSYRPIALISSTARLFSKILVNRIQRVFARIISPDQQGFISGRSSHNNIQRLQQVVDCIKSEPEAHAQSTILQLDFQKAFDRVNHDFLEKRLKEIKMPGNIINGIMLLVTKQYGQFSINQFMGSSFDIQQGL
ncbi:unnamed protein product [Ambrosiozyma monospora]|uniref:Unnamed protein product n=1 Tax=Ambrosiozyma monospora TaxID=43982 RepID=A0ACB5SRD3_AMBMO|nr:unnamed protein product [Ambrosiozyma monospora]